LANGIGRDILENRGSSSNQRRGWGLTTSSHVDSIQREVSWKKSCNLPLTKGILDLYEKWDIS
jgi:hypothetical protein